MKRLVGMALIFFVVTIFGYGISWAQYGGGSSMSSSLDEGAEEMSQMESSMDVQPGDSTNSLAEQGMNVQSGDSIDSEGTGAH